MGGFLPYHLRGRGAGASRPGSNAVGSDLAVLTANTSIAPATQSLITATQTAINTIAKAQTNQQIQNASLSQVQPAVTAAQTAYNSLSSAQQAADTAVQGINLDAITGASTLDGIATFTAEQNNVSLASDLTIALGYMGRVVGNLTTAPG
jgi:hypothetical protein